MLLKVACDCIVHQCAIQVLLVFFFGWWQYVLDIFCDMPSHIY
jgi:hypothetical protein